MNGKAIIPLVAGLIVAGLAIKLGADALKRAQGSQKVLTAQVWTASKPIQRGQAVTEECLAALTLPAKNVPVGAFTDKAKLVGRVAKTTRLPGDVLLESALLPEGSPAGLPVPEGYRAVAVRIDEASGVDFHLEPGSHVDVVAYFRVRKDGQQQTIARTIIENVVVGAVGEKISVDVEEGELEKKARSASSRPVRAVTLFVKPEQVATLHLAEQTGKLKLAMRNGMDTAKAASSGMTNTNQLLFPDQASNDSEESGLSFLKSFFGPKSEPAPAVAAATPEPTPAPAAPKFIHTAWLVNGQNRIKLGWYDWNQPPVEIEDDGPNLFEQPTAPTAPRPTPKATATGTTTTTGEPQDGASDDATPTEDDPDTYEDYE